MGARYGDGSFIVHYPLLLIAYIKLQASGVTPIACGVLLI
jgi:hypothetical protein